MLRLLLFFVSFSAVAAPRVTYPPGGFQDNFWQQVQLQQYQTQLQLQSQDQYRRMLLLQDQERQIQQIEDQQNQLESRQGSMLMHQYSDRLKMYSRPSYIKSEVGKKKLKK